MRALSVAIDTLAAVIVALIALLAAPPPPCACPSRSTMRAVRCSWT